MKRRGKSLLVIGAVVAVGGVAGAMALLSAAEVLEGRDPGDQGWAALSLIGLFGGLAAVGTGLSLILRGGYLLVFGAEPPE
jgi:hypothetical protein